MRKLLENSEIDPNIHSDGTILLIGTESTNRFTGQQAFDGLVEMLDVFQLTEPITGVSKSKLLGPSLVRPSTHTYISTWVLAGEPCVADSRVPSATLYALRENRGLRAPAIHNLYQGLSVEAIEDALAFETRLKAA